jgi:uncharacterized protein (DUF924 family)
MGTLASPAISLEIAKLLERTLSEKQNNIFLSHLSDIQAPVRLTRRLTDGERLDFANQHSDIFQSLGWEVRRIFETFLDDFQAPRR